ncbi:MAG: hypothetical protein RLZZ400_410 [Actinomycetota bacterium]
MTAKLSTSQSTVAPKEGVALVLGVQSKAGKLSVVGKPPTEALRINLVGLGAQSSPENWVKANSSSGGTYLLIGIGENPGREDLRRIAGAAIRALPDFTEVQISLPTSNKDEALAVLEGASLADYEFTAYKKSKLKKPLKKIVCFTSHKISVAELNNLTADVSAIKRIRDLVNSAPNHVYPQSLANAFVTEAKKIPGVRVTVWSEKELKANRLVGILAVGQGSSRGPRLVKIEYNPKGAKKHVAFVGKGITFDSGGLTLKPGLGMLGMKYDMTGAATVGNAVLAIAQQKLKVRATAYLCVAENLPSGTASRPNDVIVYRNGKSVEITNTDAEGRLVLADGLILASEQKPDLIIDVATLTGAAKVALGTRYAGLMGNKPGIQEVSKAAQTTDELVWEMPLPAELKANLNSDVADMVNSKLGDTNGGMLTAGHFLSEFVGFSDASGKKQIPWAHLDIAGPAKNDIAPYGYVGKGATGVMLRTLVQVARNLN